MTITHQTPRQEVVKVVRSILKEKFAGQKFSVRAMYLGGGGESVHVSWFGPVDLWDDVMAATRPLAEAWSEGRYHHYIRCTPRD